MIFLLVSSSAYSGTVGIYCRHQKMLVWGSVRFDDENYLLILGGVPLLIAPRLNCERGSSPVH